MNLQKFTLGRCGEPAEHADVGARAEARSVDHREDHARTSGCSKRSRCDRVGQLDVDAEVVGVQLELVVALQGAILVHVHGEVGDAVLERELPVLVAAGLGAEVDGRGVQQSGAWRSLFL